MQPCKTVEKCHLTHTPVVHFHNLPPVHKRGGNRQRPVVVTGSSLPTPVAQESLSMENAVPPTEEDPEEEREEGMRVRVPQMRAKLDALPEGAIDKARMMRASTEAMKTGSMSAAQEHIESHPSMRGWTVDREISNTSSLVLERNGEIKVAYRGTEKVTPLDWQQNALGFVGGEKASYQMHEARKQLQRVRIKYGKHPTELLGYSRGGNMAMTLGDEFRVKTTTFNPFVTPKQLATKSNVEHTIFRTTEDVASTMLAFSRHKKNFKVSSIHPISGWHGVFGMHSLKHFINAGPRQPGGLETLMVQGVDKGQQLAQYETIDEMKTAVEQRKTFTQAVDDFNRTNGARQTVDVTEEGKLGPRIHQESGTVKYWKASGGTFTPEEKEHLRTSPVPPRRVISAEAAAFGISHDPLTSTQVEHITSLSPQQRSEFMASKRANMQAHHDLTNAAVQPHEHVIRAIMPRTSSIGVGVVTGFAAHAVMEGVDPGHHLHPVAEEAVEGAVSGVMSAGAMAALGGSVAAGPEALAGAAAYVAGAESTRAITGALRHGGMNQDGAEAVGDISGGAIGGVTAAATGFGAAVLSDVVFGTTLGASVGGPAGALLGAGLGVTMGALVGGIGWLSGHHGGHHAPSPPPPTRQELIAQNNAREHTRLVQEQTAALSVSRHPQTMFGAGAVFGAGGPGGPGF